MIIGIDIGGTKITGVLFDGKKAVRELTIKTPGNLADFKYSLRNLVNFLSAGYSIKALGVGMAGHMDSEKNIAVSSPNIKFVKNIKFKQIFPKIFKLRLENDARCFALAEARLGQGEKYRTLVGVTLGTGIGGGLVSNGNIYRGAHLGAGEVGHMLYGDGKTFEYYFKKARDKNNYAEIGKIVGGVLINLCRVVDAEAIILGGSVAQNAVGKFLPQAMAVLSANLKSFKMPKVAVSKLKHAGALGAALLFS